MAELYFSQTHEWANVEGHVATIGITDFAAQQLSDLIFINLPKVKSTVKQGEPMGEIESVKTVVDINSPLSGEVVEANDPITSNLNLVSTDPFNAGWMVKIKLSDSAELKNLLTKEAYEKLCETESAGH
ncbi:MAG: glycine cleavage system protein GcvH [Planctomycetota bacterium]